MIIPETDVCFEKERTNIGTAEPFNAGTSRFAFNSQRMSSHDKTGPGEKFLVRMAELIVIKNGNAILSTHHLGAGLGIVIHDPVQQIGGLLHAMLPDSSAGLGRSGSRPGMFVDTGMIALMKKADELGAGAENLRVYIAGAGQIMDTNGLFSLGKVNHEAICHFLEKERLNVTAADVGGLVNRTIHLNTHTGEVRVKYSGDHKDKLLCNPLTSL